MFTPSVRKSAILFSLAVCGLWPALSLRSQTPAPATGPANLAAIHASGSKRWTSEQIAASCGLTVGHSVTRDDFQTAANHLTELGTFSNVQYRFSTVAKGAVLEFQVIDGPLIPVSYDNIPWFSDDEITAAVSKDVPLFDGEAPSKGALLDSISQAIAKLLASKDIHASVEHNVVKAIATDRDVQRFRVAGVPVTVSALEFDDPIARESAAIRDRQYDVVGKPYSRLVIELFDYEQVRPVYLGAAMLGVKIGLPQARLDASASGTPTNSVHVLLPIVPGPIFKWDGVTWAGNTKIPSAALDSLVGQAGLKAGTPANGLKIQALWQSVDAEYGRLGYLDEKIDPAPQLDDQAAKVSYRASIAEGSQYHMGNLVLTGLSIEGEKRIRAAFRLRTGDPFDRAYCDEFIDTGARSAFGTLPFHYEKLGHYFQKDSDKGTVDVMLDFQ
ncbi:MAG: POTRA domain-containing protein [Candidatus Acidiferrales bacterium]